MDLAQPSETEAGDVEPAEQIQHIQQILAHADEEDFRPIGAIGPEVELVFDEPGNPFHEEYAEEEIISDRPVPVAANASPVQTPASRPVAARVDPSPALSVPMHRERTGRETDVDDSDMIVVEETYEDTPAWPVRTVTPVKQREFGHLFAKLRRGVS